MSQTREQQFGLADILLGDLVIDSVYSDIRRPEDNRDIRPSEERRPTIGSLLPTFEFLRKHR